MPITVQELTRNTTSLVVEKVSLGLTIESPALKQLKAFLEFQKDIVTFEEDRKAVPLWLWTDGKAKDEALSKKNTSSYEASVVE